MKNVQIPYELFVDLVLYHLNGEDDFDEEIVLAEEQREQARQEYLDRRGVLRATAGLLLLGSYDRSVPRSCEWQTKQSIG